MIKIACCLWFMLAGATLAAPVVVKSGEHDGFTRLVFEYAGPIAWKVGRVEDGYQLRVAGNTSGYDFTEAFRLIGKSRVAAIWADSKTSAVRIGVACECHAIPFEFRPGIIVIDLRDGPPPKGSSFEVSLAKDDEQALPTTTANQNSDPQMSYDWTRVALSGLKDDDGHRGPKIDAATLFSTDPALLVLRETMLHQLSRGAAQGVVDLALPNTTMESELSETTLESARVSLGELPGVAVTDPHLPIPLGAEGQACLAAEQLDLPTWGEEGAAFEQLALARNGLVGEFDQLKTESLTKAVRFYLYLGFGVEAQQLIKAFPSELPDQALWISMAKIVDDEVDAGSAFLGQTACNTPAALWAILSDSTVNQGTVVNSDAAFLAFSALPVLLRRHLGPKLADRFINIGDAETAGKIRNAILRAPGSAGPSIALMGAQLDMNNGEPAAAETKLQAIVDDPGPGTPEALIALVTAIIAQDLPVSTEMVTALGAVAQEQTGSENEAPARRAFILAQAASGDFSTAFSNLVEYPETEPTLWRLLVKLGPDDAILENAVLDADAMGPNVAPETAENLARRLLNLGLAEKALKWLPDEATADAFLLAQIHLQRQDGRAVLHSLTGKNSKEALSLRAKAMQLLGDEAAAARIFSEADDGNSERRSVSLSQNWTEVGKRGSDPWKSVAKALDPLSIADEGVDAAGVGPLQAGQLLAGSSESTRTAIIALLSSVPKP